MYIRLNSLHMSHMKTGLKVVQINYVSILESNSRIMKVKV